MRTAAGVVWTSPTGRSWSSPSPHQPPAAPVRPLPALPVPDPAALLTRLEWEDELPPDSPLLEGSADSGRCDDPEPADVDALARRLAWHDTTWTVDLADVQAWQDLPHPADLSVYCRVAPPVGREQLSRVTTIRDEQSA